MSTARPPGSAAGGGVGQHDRPDLLRAADREAGQEPGHRTVVADQHPLAAPVQHEAEAPRRAASGPGRASPAGGTSPRPCPRPARRQPGSAMNAAHRARSSTVDHSSAAGANALPGNSGSAQQPVGVRVGEVPVGVRRCAARRRPAACPAARAPGSRSASSHGSPRRPDDHLAEQRVGEVRVVVAAGRRQHRLRLVEPGEQLLALRPLRPLPDLADRLALQAGPVRQHPADRQAPVPGAGQVLLEPVVQVEQPVVAALHDEDGREGLGDRADPELGVRGRGGIERPRRRWCPRTRARPARRCRTTPAASAGRAPLGLLGGQVPVAAAATVARGSGRLTRAAS